MEEERGREGRRDKRERERGGGEKEIIGMTE